MIASSFASILILRHLLQGDKLRANNTLCLLDEFIQSVGVLCFDARTLGHHSEEDGARNNRLIEHLEYLVAYIKGPESEQHYVTF